jgi:hypothetical protein
MVETVKDMESTKWNARLQIDKRHRRSDGADTAGYWIVFDSPAHAAFRTNGGLKTIRTPAYFGHNRTSGPFPSARSTSGRRFGRRMYG